jgi:hypothetical protein
MVNIFNSQSSFDNAKASQAKQNEAKPDDQQLTIQTPLITEVTSPQYPPGCMPSRQFSRLHTH